MRKVHPDWDIRVHRNYQLMLGEQEPQALLDDVGDCGVFIYQPTTEFEGKNGTVPSTDKLLKLVPLGRRAISFAYFFNTGFFPIVKSGKFWTGDFWIYTAKNETDMLLDFYDREPKEFAPSFDCARRFAENLAEQSRREAECVIKMAPWILQNFQSQHMFLLHNHPAAALMAELTRQILHVIEYPKLLMEDELPFDGPTDGGLLTKVMPGYHAVHPAVVRELGLTYTPDRTGEDPHFYRKLIQELAEKRGQL